MPNRPTSDTTDITFSAISLCPTCSEPMTLEDVPVEHSFSLWSWEFIARRWRKEPLCVDCVTARHDMGLTSTWKHKEYAAKYPDGYELVWLSLSELDASESWQTAMALNASRAKS